MTQNGTNNDSKEMVSLVESDPPQFSEPRLSVNSTQKENKSKTKGTFECEICSVRFMKVTIAKIPDNIVSIITLQRGMLLCHITKTHPLTPKRHFASLTGTVKHEDKVWLCPYCERRYLSSGKRREHIKKAHPGEPIPESLFIFIMSFMSVESC